MKTYGRFIAAAVVFVIIGMPFLSYMYLRKGLSFRIDAIEALKQDEGDMALTKVLLSSDLDIVPNMVNAVVDLNDLDDGTMKEVYDKYLGNKHFTLSTYSDDETTKWGEKHFPLESHPSLVEVFKNTDLILIDTSGQVRESYVYTEESFKSFIQHLSVLLPVESSKKIKLER